MPKKNRVVFSLTTESFVIYRKKKEIIRKSKREREREMRQMVGVKVSHDP